MATTQTSVAVEEKKVSCCPWFHKCKKSKSNEEDIEIMASPTEQVTVKGEQQSNGIVNNAINDMGDPVVSVSSNPSSSTSTSSRHQIRQMDPHARPVSVFIDEGIQAAKISNGITIDEELEELELEEVEAESIKK